MRTVVMILVMLLSATFTPEATAQDLAPADKTISVKKKPKKTKDPVGRRSPGIELPCVVSLEDGVQLPGVPEEEIVSYEVFDADGISIAIFYEKADFIEFFFSEPANSIGGVCFETADYYFTGYL